MKASELIYRLARAIEENGDCDLSMCIDGNYGEYTETSVKQLDINNLLNGGKYFEIYGEVK